MGTISWEPKRSERFQMLAHIEENKRNMVLVEKTLEEVEQLKTRYNKATFNRIKKCVLCGVTMFMMCGLGSPVFASGSNAIKELGATVIVGIQMLGTVVATVMFVFDAIKCFLEGDPKRVTSSAVKFAIGIFVIYAIPELFFLMGDRLGTASTLNGGTGIFNINS